MHHLMLEVDAGTRGEILSIFQDLIDRLRTVTASLAKTSSSVDRTNMSPLWAARSQAEKAMLKDLNCHVILVHNLCDIFVANLSPCCPYQRHITALRALEIMTRSRISDTAANGGLARHSLSGQPWPFRLDLFTPKLLRLLKDLLLDPFDDVRHLSMTILLCADQSVIGTTDVMPEKLILLIRARAKTSGRADHGDGLARANNIRRQTCFRREGNVHSSLRTGELPDLRQEMSLDELFSKCIADVQGALNLAGSGITSAVHDQPLHAYFTSLRLVILGVSLRIS